MSRSEAGDTRVAVAYVRVGPDEREPSARVQRDRVQSWCDGRCIALAAVHDDLGVSAGRAIDERPGFVDALASLDEHGAGILLVTQFDRLTRDGQLLDQLAQELERRGARLVSAIGERVATDPQARQVLAAAVQRERELMRTRTKAALAQRKRHGMRVGQVPYGWRLADDGVHLEADPEEVVALERLRAMRAQGLSLRAIVERLNDEGMPARGARWHLTTVQRLLGRSDVRSR